MKTPILDSPDRPSAAYIRGMFDGMAERYTLFARLIGFGQSQRLRRAAVRSIGLGQRVLDVGCGTGDLCFAALEKVGPGGEVTGLDFSPSMLEVATRRHARRRKPSWGSFRTVQRSADELPLEEAPFDWVISAFVLRNLYDRFEDVLKGSFASLRSGGRLSLLDLTEPVGFFKRACYRAYLYTFVGLYGLLLFGKKYPVPYLPRSSGRFLKPADLCRALEEAGFTDVHSSAFVLGSVTLYEARKP